MNNSFGINEDTIDKLIFDIADCTERINVIANDFEKVMYDVSKSFATSNSKFFFNKYSELKKSFLVVNKNVLSYTEDLIKVKNRLRETDENMSYVVKTTHVDHNNPNNTRI